MTSVTINKTDDVLFIKIKGHTNYADHGYDIVCASISTASIMSINLLEVLGLKNQIKHMVYEDGLIELELLPHNNIVKGIFNNLEYTLIELSKQYKKHIKINN